ncbi:MAG: hypothetical protein H6993_04775 [Pseudomonadales bacterium]|nr:hypothetical protein [Pseudomonadales bacterium]MCP5183253.1 hypothetical protein [Pseudomonadales bacterium]
MTARLLLLLGLLGVGSALPALADDKEEKAAVAATGEEDPMVCKRVKKAGTYFREKVCMKKSEWKEMRLESQRAAKEMTTRPNAVGS